MRSGIAAVIGIAVVCSLLVGREAFLRETTLITFRTGGGKGGPAYDIVVHGNGLVEFYGEQHVDSIGWRYGHIPRDSVCILVDDLLRNNFFNFKLTPTGEEILGAPDTILSMKLAWRKREISAVPRGLSKSSDGKVAYFVRRIEEVTNSDRWTGLKARMHRIDSLMQARERLGPKQWRP